MAAQALDVAPSIRVMLWTHARSRSTAFELAIASEPSIKVFHEQFIVAYFYGSDRKCSELYLRAPPMSGNAYQEVKNRLETKWTGKRVIFAKDGAFGLGSKDNYKYLPYGYTHTFLIRDPIASILSLYKCIMKRHPEDEKLAIIKMTIEVGDFKSLYELYKYVTEEMKQPAIIMESDDLMMYPKETMQKYCLATGIPFSENFLHWKPGNVDHFPDFMKEPTFFNIYYKTVVESTCFQPPTQSPLDLSELPGEIKREIENVTMPLYREMARNKL